MCPWQQCDLLPGLLKTLGHPYLIWEDNQDLAVLSSVSNHHLHTVGETNKVSSSQTPATIFSPPKTNIISIAQKNESYIDKLAILQSGHKWKHSVNDIPPWIVWDFTQSTVITEPRLPAQSFFSIPNQISILQMPSFHMSNKPKKQRFPTSATIIEQALLEFYTT